MRSGRAEPLAVAPRSPAVLCAAPRSSLPKRPDPEPNHPPRTPDWSFGAASGVPQRREVFTVRPDRATRRATIARSRE